MVTVGKPLICSCILCICGCGAQASGTLARYVVTVPSKAQQDLDKRILRLDTLASEAVIPLIETAIETGHPYIVGHALLYGAQWAKSKIGREEVFLSLLAKCLTRADPMIRIVSASVAYENLEQRDMVCSMLIANPAVLLVRPEAEALSLLPVTKEQKVRNTQRMLVAGFIAGCRQIVVNAAGEVGTSSVLPALESIRDDPKEWHEPTKEAAIEAIAKLQVELDSRGSHRLLSEE